MAGELIEHFIQGMQELGFASNEIISIVSDAVESKGEERGDNP